MFMTTTHDVSVCVIFTISSYLYIQLDRFVVAISNVVSSITTMAVYCWRVVIHHVSYCARDNGYVFGW